MAPILNIPGFLSFPVTECENETQLRKQGFTRLVFCPLVRTDELVNSGFMLVNLACFKWSFAFSLLRNASRIGCFQRAVNDSSIQSPVFLCCHSSDSVPSTNKQFSVLPILVLFSEKQPILRENLQILVLVDLQIILLLVL